jgi:hypothetical protein
MTDSAVERLRARASRGDYTSITRLAKALYDRGLRARDVLRECYGADFPAEFFATAGERLSRPPLLATFTNLPWKLVAPGESSPPSAPSEELEKRIFTRDPDLVPLVRLIGSRTTRERPVICYRLSELRAGRTTIFGIKATATARDPITQRGESVLDVLRTHHADVLQHMEWLLDQPWNRGFGPEDQKAVNEVRSLLERIEELQRQATSRQEG